MPQIKKESSVSNRVSANDALTIAELAELFGLPIDALVQAVNRNRQAVRRPFYTIRELAERWRCSRATVYNELRDREVKLFAVGNGEKRKKQLIPAAAVERIENQRVALPETAVA